MYQYKLIPQSAGESVTNTFDIMIIKILIACIIISIPCLLYKPIIYFIEKSKLSKYTKMLLIVIASIIFTILFIVCTTNILNIFI